MEVKIIYPSGQMTVYLDKIVEGERLGKGFTHPIDKVRKIFKLMVQWCDFEVIEQVQKYLNTASPRYAKEFAKLKERR